MAGHLEERGPQIRIDWTLLTAFAAGTVAGAVTALLYAPSDGASMRKDISDRATAGLSGVSKQVDALTTNYGHTFVTARFQVERLFAAVTAGIEEGRRVRNEIYQVLSEENKK